MSTNYGKEFEQVFKKDWLNSFKNSFIFRLNDQMNGYKVVSKNPCDFICFAKNKLFLVECKSHRGASIPIANITQYQKLVSYSGIDGVFPGVILWLIDKDRVLFLPIKSIENMINDNKKSISIKDVDKYNLIDIPSIKKRVFMESDYSILGDLNYEY